jgi:hypothetical protein
MTTITLSNAGKYVGVKAPCKEKLCASCEYRFQCLTKERHHITINTLSLFMSLTEYKGKVQKQLCVGQWVKVRWSDVPEDWWIAASRIQYGTFKAFNLVTGNIRNINQNQIKETGEIVKAPL